MRHLKHATLLGLGALVLAGCELDRNNPNAPTQEATVNTPEGIQALAVGLQTRYGAEQGAFIYASGLFTDELGAVSAALVTISDAETGSVGQGANLVADVFGGAYRVIKTANDIIGNAPNVELEAGSRSGVLTLAYTIKANAYGDLVQSFRQVILDPSSTDSPFVDRNAALDYALALLDTAELRMADAPFSATFTGTVLGRGLDLPNTIRAYRARLNRIRGNNAAALAAANTVSRSVFSVLPFDANNPNPVFVLSPPSTSGALPRDAFRTSIPVGQEAWVNYHVTAAPLTGRISTPLDNYARYGVAASSIPTYYPDEMLLIKAEVLAIQNDLTGAQAALDSVRTDCAGAGGRTDLDPNPCLAPLVGPLTQTALLDEIYRARRYELFATGLRWEDARRRNAVGTGNAAAFAERCWLPYPIGERNGRSNVPADPEQFDPPTFPATCGTT